MGGRSSVRSEASVTRCARFFSRLLSRVPIPPQRPARARSVWRGSRWAPIRGRRMMITPRRSRRSCFRVGPCSRSTARWRGVCAHALATGASTASRTTCTSCPPSGRHEGERRRRGGSLGRVPAPKPAPVAEEAEQPASVEPASVERIGITSSSEPAPARLVRGRRAPGEQRPRGAPAVAARKTPPSRPPRGRRQTPWRSRWRRRARGWQTPRCVRRFQSLVASISASRPPSKRARASDDTGDDPGGETRRRAERRAHHWVANGSETNRIDATARQSAREAN